MSSGATVVEKVSLGKCGLPAPADLLRPLSEWQLFAQINALHLNPPLPLHWMVFFRFPSTPIKLALRYLSLDESLMMQACATRSHSAVEPGRRLGVLVAEQLAHGFECTGLVIENGFGAEVPELVRRELDPCPLAQRVLDQQGDHCLTLGCPVGVYKNPVGPSTDHFGRNAVAKFDQHPLDLRRDIECQRGFLV